jgi:hypothetical protein
MTGGRGASQEDTVQLSIRYRPSADVLIAQVNDVADEAVQRDRPDADTTLEWVRRPDGSRHLVGLQVLFAAARADAGQLSPAISERLDERLLVLLDTLDNGDDASRNPLASTALEIEVPDAELVLPDDLTDFYVADPSPALTVMFSSHSMVARPDLPDIWSDDGTDPGDVGDALVDLADAISTCDADADADPTARLIATLRELAATIRRSGGRTAPGCTAAARVALRGGTPLTARERKQLADLLDSLDDPTQWADAVEGIDDLTARLDRRTR